MFNDLFKSCLLIGKHISESEPWLVWLPWQFPSYSCLSLGMLHSGMSDVSTTSGCRLAGPLLFGDRPWLSRPGFVSPFLNQSWQMRDLMSQVYVLHVRQMGLLTYPKENSQPKDKKLPLMQRKPGECIAGQPGAASSLLNHRSSSCMSQWSQETRFAGCFLFCRVDWPYFHIFLSSG